MENRDPRENSPSPAKRSSIENLKRASRVKNSTMFAREQKHEYDPTSSPMLERPLANGRPLNSQTQLSGSGSKTFESPHHDSIAGAKSHSEQSPTKSGSRASMPSQGKSFNKAFDSPTKSSLSSRTRYGQHNIFDADGGIWSDEEDSIAERQLPPGRGLHRHAKSVTFDVAPPQINEYEQATPDPSSVASGSREGSHDSLEDDDESFERGDSLERDDSFDASLEDTDKTPVVLPDDWRFMSPDTANDELTARVDDPFNGRRGSPAANARPSSAVEARSTPVRTDSTDSSGEHRPLPPIPGYNPDFSSHLRSDSRNSLFGIVDRLEHGQRHPVSPPQPASMTKSEIQGMTASNMTIDERVKLMMVDEEDKKAAAEEQRDRRLRRASPTRSPQTHDDQCSHSSEAVDEIDDLADLDLQQAPRISRESILRKVKDKSREKDEISVSTLLNHSSCGTTLENLDPDVPLPSTEFMDENEPFVKREADEESEVDVYKIPDLYSQHLQAESFMSAIDKLEAIKRAQEEERQQSIESRIEDDDEGSHYSVQSEANEAQTLRTSQDDSDPEELSTPKVSTDGTHNRGKQSHRMSLPQFAALLGDNGLDFGMESFMSDAKTSPVDVINTVDILQTSTGETTRQSKAYAEFQRPITPEAQLDPPKFPGLGRGSTGESSIAESVVHHPVPLSPAPESPGVPEPVATIKASGTKLKTRQSATPTDIQAMADVRRQVSGEVPAVPKIPSQHMENTGMKGENGGSETDMERDVVSDNITGEEAKQPKRKSSLAPLDLQVEPENGLGIEGEFDRLLEAQKVEYPFLDSVRRSPHNT